MATPTACPVSRQTNTAKAAVVERQAIYAGVVAWGVLLGFACVEQEPYPYERVYDQPLVIVEVDPDPEDPSPIARNQQFSVTFNTYLDSEALPAFSAGLGLRSGGVRSFGQVRYSMVDKTLTWTTTRPMEPSFLYNLTFDGEVLRTVTGQPYVGPSGIPFEVGIYNQYTPPPDEPPTWAAIEPILEPCNTCHADPSWLLRPIDYDNLVGQRSDLSADKVLVIPFDAPRSVLMHVLVWDYPLRDVTAQPPAWAGYEQLSRDDQRRIERWIRGGAQP